MDVRRADLHTHTVCSDGRLTPAELVRKAHECGLRALAITDHDAVDAYAVALPHARKLGLELIPGVELSVTVDGEEIHVLGYCFNPDFEPLVAHVTTFRRERSDRAVAIVNRLDSLGIELGMEDVMAQAEDGVVGRPHIAQAMVEKGVVASYMDAFEHYLKDDGPAFVAKPLFPAAEAIKLLRDAGGVAVLAHPGTRVSGPAMRKLIDLGLDGIETIHPSHSPALTRRYKDLARKFGLIETGGSDYHGFRPEEDQNLSRYSIPYRRLELIRRAAA